MRLRLKIFIKFFTYKKKKGKTFLQKKKKQFRVRKNNNRILFDVDA